MVNLTFSKTTSPDGEELSAGMVGYITASIKNVKDTRVGDTITDQFVGPDLEL